MRYEVCDPSAASGSLAFRAAQIEADISKVEEHLDKIALFWPPSFPEEFSPPKEVLDALKGIREEMFELRMTLDSISNTTNKAR